MKTTLLVAASLAACAVIATANATTISYNVVAGFNDTGTQPQAGNPFTYGTAQTLNGPFTLFPNFGTANCTFGVCTRDGSVKNYRFLRRKRLLLTQSGH